jgi:hypothetical protein
MALLITDRPFTLMDLPAAAGYADVPVAEIHRAVEHHEFPVLADVHGAAMLRSTDLDLWCLWALGRPPAGLHRRDRHAVAFSADLGTAAS